MCPVCSPTVSISVPFTSYRCKRHSQPDWHTTDRSPNFNPDFKLANEQDIREKIAQEIEAEMNNEGGHLASDHIVMDNREIAVWELCAAIARGQK